MQKLLIGFADPQVRWLRARAAQMDISVSELVRRLVDTQRPDMSTDNPYTDALLQRTLAGAHRSLEAMEEAFGEQSDAVAYRAAFRALVRDHER